jgi:hypothetical protein
MGEKAPTGKQRGFRAELAGEKIALRFLTLTETISA